MAFHALADYGIIGNDDRCALVSTTGSIDWCCFPHVASPSVFARLLDEERGGRFAIRPTDSYSATQTYRHRTNVLQTTFETDSGRATLIDFMPISGSDSQSTFQPAIYRRLHCVDGALSVEAEFVPRLDYGRTPTAVKHTSQPTETADTAECLIGATDDEQLFVQTHGKIDLELRASSGTEPAGDASDNDSSDESADDAVGDRAVGTTTLTEGDVVWFGLQYGEYTHMPPAECRERLEDTIDYWQTWVDDFEQSAADIVGDDPWVEHVVRSGLVLKLLINNGTGAIYAAPTTSLPETYGSDHNWDYRYNWIRDAKFTVQALFNFGKQEEATRYFEWFESISGDDPASIQPLYGVHGETELTEYELDHLAGHRYSQPVRVGNAAADQRQLDVYGAIIQGIYETLHHDEALSDSTWQSIRSIVEHVCAVWDEPDAGIWEFRGEQRHYVHSKLLCWVAIDRALELADRYDRPAPAERWNAERDAIRSAILEQGYSERAGSFVQHFGTDEALDASALLIPIYEFLPPDDPRVESTIQTVLDELLTDSGLVYRTKYTEAIAPEPNAFLLCSFWLVDALVLAGRTERAESLFRQVLEHTTPLGLLSERVDPQTGELFGNYPQAFSHIGLINSAIYLCSADSGNSLQHDPQSVVDGGVLPLFRRQ